MNETNLPQPVETCIDASMTVAQVMEKWPETVSVFLRYKASCAGCSLARFETLAEAARVYRFDLPVFLHDLTDAATGSLVRENE